VTIVFDAFRVIYAYLLPLAIGATLLDLIDRRPGTILSFGEKLSCGFLIGFGIQSLYVFFLGVLRIRFTLLSCSLLGWLVLAGWAVLTISKRDQKNEGVKPRSRFGGKGNLKFITIILATLITVKLAMSLFAALSKPAYFDDTVSIWNYRAKVFYLRQSLVLDPRDGDFLGGRVQKYPPGVPLFKAWVAFCRGRWEEGEVNLITFFCYLSLAGIVFFNFRRILEPPWDLALTLVAISIPLLSFHALFAYVDIIIVTCLFAGVAYLYQWVVGRKNIFLLLSALLIAPSLFTKDEGLVLTATGVIPPLFLCLFLKRKSLPAPGKALLAYLGILAVWGLPWYLTKIAYGFPISLPPEYRRFEFHPEVLPGIGHYLFASGNFNILYTAAFLLIVLNARKMIHHPLRYPALAWGGIFIATVYPFIFSPFSEFLGTAFGRAILNSTPLLVFLIGMLLAELTGNRSAMPEDESAAH
jgi:hypothetical protein